LAFTKKHKTKMVSDYETWLNKSQAVFMIEYNKMTMKDIDALRAKVRETGSEAHIVKNTLMQLAMKNAGYADPKKVEGTLLVGFAFDDPPALAKVFADASTASRYARHPAGCIASPCFQTRPHFGRTRPFSGSGGQSLFRNWRPSGSLISSKFEQ
jgi:ribosomal protein L10